MLISIEYAENGAIVDRVHTDKDDKDFDTTKVYEFDEENKQGLVDMLYDICEDFSINSKHNKENIVIKLEEVK